VIRRRRQRTPRLDLVPGIPKSATVSSRIVIVMSPGPSGGGLPSESPPPSPLGLNPQPATTSTAAATRRDAMPHSCEARAR
jgi:hypothetical protein